MKLPVRKVYFDKIKKGNKYDGVPHDLTFFGFDTVHAWNTPPTQTFDYAKKQTIALADEMIKRRI